MAISIIEIRNLNKSYGSLKALKNVTCTVEKGEILGVLGPNGAGKTTLLKNMLGLVYPDSGTIFINGVDVIKNRSKALEQIGAILEGSRNIYHHLSSIQNMEYFYRVRGLSYNAIVMKRCQTILEKLGLANIHKEVRKLSRGMQQKVAIACAMTHNPDILLLDEPTIGLDVEIANSMKKWLLELATSEGKTILITSHNLHFIETICDRVFIIKNGEMIKQSGIDDLKKSNSQHVYKMTIQGKLTTFQKQEIREFSQCTIYEKEKKSQLVISFLDSKTIYRLFDVLKSNENEIIEITKSQDTLENIFLTYISESDNEKIL